MNSQILKYSISLQGHRTSITLEPFFWEALKRIAHKKGIPISQLVSEIERTVMTSSKRPNLSSSIRLFIVREILACPSDFEELEISYAD